MTADSAERQGVQRYGFDYRGDRIELRNGEWVRYADVKPLLAEIERLRRAEAQVEAMRKDAERLDWLERGVNSDRFYAIPNNLPDRRWMDADSDNTYPTMRAAIDAAISQEDGPRAD